MAKKNLSYELFFCVAYLMLMASVMLSSISCLNNFLSIIQIIGVLMLTLIFVFQNEVLKKNTFLRILAVVVISFLSYYFSKNSTLTDSSIIMLVLMVLASKNIDFDKIVKFDFWIKSILVVIVVLLYFLGFSDDIGMIYRNNSIRYSLGFGHPNILGITIASIVIEYVYLKQKNLKKRYLFPLLIGLMVVSLVTDSRGSLFLIILVFLLILLKKILFSIIYNKNIKIIVKNSFLIFTLISFFMTFLYSKNLKLGIILNDIFSNRLYYANTFLNYYDFTPFGQTLIFTGASAVELYGSYTQILDNCFIYILLRFGFSTFFMLCYLFNNAFKIAYDRKNTMLIWILLFFIIYGLMEKYPTVIFYNVFLLYFSNVIYKDEKGK